MAKEVNIHVRAKGTQQTKQELDGVGRSAEQMGSRTSRAAKWITDGLKSLIGPLGFAAIATALAAAAVKVAKFFDELKKRSDEAVRSLQNMRREFESLFEAMDAFDERSRQRITKQTAALLKETAVSKEISLPIINAYTRQYRDMVKTGQLTEAQYQQGLRETLGYGARHGGAATTELVAIMRGWGMATPEQQGIFRRQIAAGAAASGLTDAELIGALGRGMPTVKAMGWTPAQAVETIATIAAGETGRKRASLPATTLQGLLALQEANLVKYGISEQVTPQQLLMQLQQKRGQMTQQAFTTMLTDIYGTEAAAGVSKLLTAPRRGIREAITQAATAEAIAAEQEEERTSRATQERRDARAKARVMEEQLDVTTREQYEEDVREIGEAARETRKRHRPTRQWFEDFFTFGEEKEKEYAAFRTWYENLTSDEKEKFHAVWRKGRGTPFDVWQYGLTPQQKYESLVEGKVPEIHYHHENIMNYFPRYNSDERGPRAPSNIR